MTNYYHITDFRNLSSYLALGFIIPNHISYLTSKYYHIGANSWKDTILYSQKNIPKNLPESAVIIDLGDILDKSNFLIKKSGRFITNNGNIIIGKLNKYENYIPITAIKKIIFSNDEILGSFNQMEFGNTFKLGTYQFDIDENNIYFVSDNTTSQKVKKDDGELFDKSNYIEKYNFNKFEKNINVKHNKSTFINNLTFHFTISDYALSNNIYNKDLDSRIPKRYKKVD